MNELEQQLDERNNKEDTTFTISKTGVITLYIKDKVYCIANDHPFHRTIIEKLKNKDFDNLENMVCSRQIFEYAFKAEIVNDQIIVNGAPLHNELTKRTLELAHKGYNVEFMLKFLANCEQNPSNKAINELYDFLANRNLPLTEDGCFLAYKRVRDDWYDIYSGTILNKVGTTISIDRKSVDDNRRNECSRGLHVGALEYVRRYGSGGHIVLVKVNPKDCISVPLDHQAQKLRVCSYEILYELNEDEPLPMPVYSSNGSKITSVSSWQKDNEVSTEEEAADEYWAEGWE